MTQEQIQEWSDLAHEASKKHFPINTAPSSACRGAFVYGANWAMEQLFTRDQLVMFGNYLLSPERRERFANNPNPPEGTTLEERLSEVHHADVENFIAGVNNEVSSSATI